MEPRSTPARAFAVSMTAVALASACGAQSDFAAARARDDAGFSDARATGTDDAPGRGAGGAGVGSVPGRAAGGAATRATPDAAGDGAQPPRDVPDAAGDGAQPPRDVPDGSVSGVHAFDAAVDGAGAVRDATVSVDGPRESAATEVPTAPDCTCPVSGYFLDTTFGGVPLHLTAPYVLGIYCQETAVQLAHPACGELYRLSACNGPGGAPPCFYMGVELSLGFLLGHFVDATGETWDIVDGTIAPGPPMERVGTGTFSASLKRRTSDETASLSGNFRACMPRFPACTG